MEQKVFDWVKTHRKEIAIVAVTAFVVSRFTPRKNVAYVQDADGTYWVLNLKQVSSL